MPMKRATHMNTLPVLFDRSGTNINATATRPNKSKQTRLRLEVCNTGFRLELRLYNDL
jgi:hypothetical protein